MCDQVAPATKSATAEDGEVHERRAEVGLDEDEEGREADERDRLQDGPEPPDLAVVVCEEAAEAERDEDLAELGRLEAEEADLDPALRAAHGVGDEDDEEQDDQDPVERSPERRQKSGLTAASATNATTPSATLMPCRVT